MKRLIFLVSLSLVADTWQCIKINSGSPTLVPSSPTCESVGSSFVQNATFSPKAVSDQTSGTVWSANVTVSGTGVCPELATYKPTFAPSVQVNGSTAIWYVDVMDWSITCQNASCSTSSTHTPKGQQNNVPWMCTCYQSDCSRPGAASQCTSTCASGGGGGSGCGTCPCGYALCGSCCFVPNSPCGSPPQNALTCCNDSGGTHPCCYGQIGSPILIKGGVWAVSDYANGVIFDLYGTGVPLQIPWPLKGSGDGWLVLPDAQGAVSSGKQLFGNATTGSDTYYSCGNYTAPGGPNGFRALAQYDANHDCVIDARDPIWPHLMVWYDYAPRNGLVDPGELVPVSTVLDSIPLTYRLTPFTDAHGTAYRYCATKSFCDVILVRGN